MRIIALDVGDKRIGVAVSDPTCTIATGLATINRENEDAAGAIKAFIGEYAVCEVVVGMPLGLDGKEGQQARKVREFAAQLKQELSVPVKEWDERLTSAQADRTLLSFDASRKKRKLAIDEVAAVLILQNYLDNLNRKM